MSRVSMHQSVALQERMCARRDPITGVQVERFSKFPDTALTPLCVEAHRFPEMFRTNLASNFIQIDVSPDGEPCLMTEVDGFCVCLVGDDIYRLAPTTLKSGDTHYRIKLLGFVNAADVGRIFAVEPVCLVRGESGFEDNLTPWHKFVTRKNRLCQGEKILLEMPGLIDAIMLEEDTFLLFSLMNNTTPFIKISLMIDGQVKVDWQPLPLHIPFKTLREFGFTTSGIYMRFTAPVPHNKEQLLATQPLNTAVWFPPELQQLIEENGDDLKQSVEFRLETITLPEHTQYLRWAQNVQWNYTYVARSARDHMECWNIHKQSQPAFRSVSQLFERDGNFFYYALGDDHWFLMELPLAE